MKRFVPVVLVLLIVGTLAAAGCATNTDLKTDAEKQIAAAKASLERAKSLGVEVPADELNLIAKAEAALDSNSTEALILATEAKANIENNIDDAFARAKETYNTAKGAAETVISRAPAGTNLDEAKRSLASAEEKANAAKTIEDWYNASSGPIYFANLAAQQATQAALAQASASAAAAAEAAELQRITQGAQQMRTIMVGYLQSKGANPADYNIGVTRISDDANWATGTATPRVNTPGASPISFLMQFENGNWVLRAAPSWTPGQFGAPANMVP